MENGEVEVNIGAFRSPGILLQRKIVSQVIKDEQGNEIVIPNSEVHLLKILVYDDEAKSWKIEIRNYTEFGVGEANWLGRYTAPEFKSPLEEGARFFRQ